MRPVRLTLRGFGAFRDEVSLDVDDVDAFALIGPTGSGKSTVLDAMCFALYGRVPRHGRGAATGDVLSVGANELAVALEFDIAENRYVVARVVRRKGRAGKATTAEARLEELDRVEGNPSRPIANGAREVDEAVEQLVGLSFEQFTRCVLLPQGEFARFLHDEPRDRRGLLLRLLDLGFYESMRARADHIARTQHVRADTLIEQRAAVADGDSVVLEQAVAALRALDESIEHDIVELRTHDERLDGLQSERAAIARRIELLRTIELPADTGATADDRARAASQLNETAAAVEARSQTWETLLATRAERPPVGVLRDLVTVQSRIEKGRSVVEALAPKVAMATKAADERRNHLEQAERDLAAARSSVRDAERRHAAHGLLVGLRSGEPCPVCLQVVTDPPEATLPVELDALLKADAAAERAVAAAKASHDQAQRSLQDVVAEQRDLTARLEALQESVAPHPDRVALEAQLANAEAAEHEEQAAKEALDAARRQLATAQARQAAIDKHEQGRSASFHRARDTVAEFGPPAPTGDVDDDWTSLVSWAAQTARTQGNLLKDVENARANATELRARVVEGIVTSARNAGLPLGLNTTLTEVEQFRRLLATKMADAAGAIAHLRSEQARAVALDEEAARARRDAEVAASLALHLRSNNFQDWLVSEAIESLAHLASDMLRSLSDGAYSLIYRDDTFAVVDHLNGDEIRSARSLSGGETFQASLALAFALADEIARQRTSVTRLDAVFLDEGFGTLDPESLDKVAATLDELRDGRRLVGIVTHVAELAQRQPVRFRVIRTGKSSTIVREQD